MYTVDYFTQMTTENMQRILVVDDDWLNHELMESILTLYGFAVIQAHNGEQALEIAKRDLPDLILLDVRMPGMDGLEICKRLRAEATTNKIPIIMLTGQERNSQEKSTAINAGANAFISRMLMPDEIVAQIRDLI